MYLYIGFPVVRAGSFYLWRNVQDPRLPVVSPPDWIPPRSAYRLNTEGDQMYHRLVDLYNVDSLATIRPGDAIYTVQDNQEGTFPAGMYRSNVILRQVVPH